MFIITLPTAKLLQFKSQDKLSPIILIKFVIYSLKRETFK